MHFWGYPRPDGRVGTRNLVAIIPTVFCANLVSRRIAEAVRGAVAFPHPVGCGYPGPDQVLTGHMLRRIAAHPNFGAVVFVSLGCERLPPSEVLSPELERLKPVAVVSIQEEGNTARAIATGTEIAQRFAGELSRVRPVQTGAEGLVVALKCGGTDAASGLAANPALGVASDRIIAAGGTAVITEITELIGTEHIMARRAVTPEVAAAIHACVAANEIRLERATRAVDDADGHHGPNGGAISLVTPGNLDGGVTTVVEKALGGLKKAGDSPFSGVTGYGDPLPGKGLYLMDGPSHDGESVTGMVAAGANVVVFTTGRGTPSGFPGVPVIKVTGNPDLCAAMGFNIDVDTGPVLRKGVSLTDMGETLLSTVLEVASGGLTKSEICGHEELFCISRFVTAHQICERG